MTVGGARLKRFAALLAGKMRKRDLSTAKEATAPTEVDRPGESLPSKTLGHAIRKALRPKLHCTATHKGNTRPK